ncbi:MAG: macro domain-containing protein [Kiritimatiellae bacterium]|nr:macro domain-containing protein [Kiritimatiellia bacterium]
MPASCYRNCFSLAIRRRISTMSFPSISAGAYRFPVERAARIALAEILSALRLNADLQKVVIVCFDRRTYDCYERALAETMKRGGHGRRQ